MLNKIEEIKDLIGEFTYCWGNTFFVETSIGNFVWMDPDYAGGDNSLTPYKGTLKEFYKEKQIPYGRDKGRHVIKEYCGEKVWLKHNNTNL